MNMQAIMKQAQKLQKEMTDEKNRIDAMEFEAQSSFVSVKMNGKKQVLSIKIDNPELSNEDLEVLEDLIMIAINNAGKKVDQEVGQKLGKYTQNMPGIF